MSRTWPYTDNLQTTLAGCIAAMYDAVRLSGYGEGSATTIVCNAHLSTEWGDTPYPSVDHIGLEILWYYTGQPYPYNGVYWWSETALGAETDLATLMANAALNGNFHWPIGGQPEPSPYEWELGPHNAMASALVLTYAGAYGYCTAGADSYPLPSGIDWLRLTLEITANPTTVIGIVIADEYYQGTSPTSPPWSPPDIPEQCGRSRQRLQITGLSGIATAFERFASLVDTGDDHVARDGRIWQIRTYRGIRPQ